MADSSELTGTLLTDADREYLRTVFGARVGFDEALAPVTSWKIGGPADALAVLNSTDELAVLLTWLLRRKLPWFILGSGSNLLVGDGGIRGVVLRLAGAFTEIRTRVEGERVFVRAGGSASMPRLTAEAASLGACGVGSLAGIPGTLGGSLRMNAGTDREIGDFVREVRVQTPTHPQPRAVSLEYFYRRTTLDRDAIVADVELTFEQGDPLVVRDEMQRRLVRRKATQPLRLPNSGSCFRNPPGDKAGRLIEAIGAKGWREGNAQVSDLHANFIVNLGEATASDVASLLARVRRAVAERFGVELELEVHFVGVFS
ncbi:MAG TPA: UDP-N-acetylmuramate dehydrogenase [Candidatus Baltobacteraceae bacterium]|jgi:UDP-N-acetylmuramate dehydrogenase|nr:UDP-N-acetylmuramate dehydrogenase [Candidatus Baltobacteraceae bacterium]